MGIHITLDIKFNKVSNKLWTETFNEVISFINKTPLGYRKPFNHNNKQFIIYNKPEILKDNKGYEYIELSADLNRLTHCESFKLYSSKDAYNSNNIDPDYEYSVWNSKTQKFSYHKYILAIGMLIEHKLKGVAYVSGDITEEEISLAKSILKDTLNINVDTPARFETNDYLAQMLALMSMLGARVGDYIAEKDDCIDFANHIVNNIIDGNRTDLNTFSNDELREIILDESNNYSFTWSKEILDSILNTTNRDILLGYAGILTVDCKNINAFEYVSRFFKDTDVYSSYLDILTSKKPSLNHIK